MVWQGLAHDLSKFLPFEFIWHAHNFYGRGEGADEEGITMSFDEARLYHIHRNKHHWEYWLRPKTLQNLQVLEMPKKYAIEMVCDWAGVDRALTGRRDGVLGWYKNNKNSIILHSITREYVEELLDLYKESLRKLSQ